MRNHVKSILSLGLALAVALAGLTVTTQSAVAKKIYRCVDEKKNVTVSDTPCVGPAAAEGGAAKSAPADGYKKDAKDAKDGKGGGAAPAPKKDAKG